jgi:hypothetical protein
MLSQVALHGWDVLQLLSFFRVSRLTDVPHADDEMLKSLPLQQVRQAPSAHSHRTLSLLPAASASLPNTPPAPLPQYSPIGAVPPDSLSLVPMGTHTDDAWQVWPTLGRAHDAAVSALTTGGAPAATLGRGSTGTLSADPSPAAARPVSLEHANSSSRLVEPPTSTG